MSVNTSSVTSQSTLADTQPNIQAPQIPTFLQTASKVTKLMFAVIFAVVGLGSLGIGITMMPFAPEPAMATIAFGTALLATAGYLFYSGLSSAPDLNSRDVTTQL